jgi:hypothetical protein
MHVMQDVKKELILNITLNSEAYMEIDDETCEYVPTGNSVEVGLLNFIECFMKDDLNSLLQRKERNSKLAAKIPFCP